MPDGKVIVIAVAIAALVYGGYKAGVEVRDHVVRPVGCSVKVVFTAGHKHCQPKPQKAGAW